MIRSGLATEQRDAILKPRVDHAYFLSPKRGVARGLQQVASFFSSRHVSFLAIEVLGVAPLHRWCILADRLPSGQGPTFLRLQGRQWYIH